MNIVKKAFCRVFQAAFKLAIPFLPYREPEIKHSVLEIKEILSEKQIDSALLVTDRSLRQMGLTKALEDDLAAAGVRLSVYDGTRPNPTVENVEEALAVYKANDCRALIALGGGSSMDCAKAVGARVAYPRRTLDGLKGILRVWKKIPLLIAIPTTAGTGSEVTVTAVITDAQKHHKYTMNSFPLIPRYAVLDPEMTRSLPPHLVSTTGMDALTHAVEAFIGRSTTKKTRAWALEAARLIFENLERAYRDSSDTEARANMLRAAYLAGEAFSMSYVGYIHAIAHSLGGQYNIPHGLANSVLMPYLLDAYGPAIHRQLKEMAVAVGLAQKTEDEKTAAERFIAEVRAMNSRMNIPEKLSGIRRADIPLMAAHADKEANPLYPVPVLMDRYALEQYYLQAADWSETTMNNADIDTLLDSQRAFYRTGATQPVSFRIDMLRRLYAAVKKYENEINEALKQDLGKSAFEGFMCETGLVLTEISYMIRHTRGFARRHIVYTPIAQFASTSYTKASPYGNTLIMSPWNYPFLLTIDPLADAIAAGNTAIVKPSAYSPATGAVIAKMLSETFAPEYVAVVTGGRKENAALLDKKFDFIFFTGSQTVGKEVLRKAAEHLTPAVLELGGKSPCIVDSSAKIKLAARRIVFGKFLNCGQTCVAPDYILCDAAVKDELVREIKAQIEKQYGKDPLKNPDFGKIINEKHFDRLCGLIDPAKVVFGGNTSRETLQIAPTVMDNVHWDDAVMQEEIFGPIMPILTYDKLEDVVDMLGTMPKPLALYFYSEDNNKIKMVMDRCQFGGGCVNDCIIHLATSEMGFGGVGESGMGAYHGKRGFDAFSHTKSIVDKKTWMDLPMRYQPYKKLYDWLLHIVLR